MSRLIDMLNMVARVTAQPMGFGANRASAAASRLLLIAGLAKGGDAAGADAVLYRQEPSAAAGALPEIPWGCWTAGIKVKKAGRPADTGGDFLVFAADGPVLSAPRDDKVGRILQVEAGLDDGLLRAVNDLPVDAVLFTGGAGGGSLAWQGLMQVQRLTNLLTKPLLVTVPVNVTEVEIGALWEAGVAGVLVEVEGAAPEGLQGLRRIIDGLPPRTARRRGKNEALLPRIGTGASTTAEEEEEDDDWDDE